MEITELYLQGNYERYLDNCRDDATAPLPYDDWKQWFLETFGVSVVNPPNDES